MRQAEGAHQSIALPRMRRDVPEALAQAPSADRRAAQKKKRTDVRVLLLEAREAAPKALPALR
jgi:hypothetical protein